MVLVALPYKRILFQMFFAYGLIGFELFVPEILYDIHSMICVSDFQ